ncbi:MAG: amidohydrolase family protein [Clostridia bacterium]|nr:amidohydrolase family protein [Clostridia bacterium]
MRGLAEAGIKGIKLHPDYMRRAIDDPCYDRIFDACADLGLFVLTHAGFDVYSPDRVYASPDLVLRRLERSPGTTLIAAHYGGNMMWDEVEEKLCGRELYIDTSLGGLTKLAPAQAARILEKHDPERILFGSDCPWCTSADTFRYVDALPLSDDRKEKIFHTTAERLLGLSD